MLKTLINVLFVKLFESNLNMDAWWLSKDCSVLLIGSFITAGSSFRNAVKRVSNSINEFG